MDVLFLSPHYPGEMHHFTRGLAEVGARVWGVGDQPFEALPPLVRGSLSAYLPVPSLMDEDDVIARVLGWLGDRVPDRVESLWEPMVVLAARLRERLGVPGLPVEGAVAFRDKGRMKEKVAAAGLRVPRAFRTMEIEGVRQAAETIGYPVVVKPIAGAGSADTFRVDSPGELELRLPGLRHVPEVSVEEYIDGEEFTFDALCIDNRVVYQSVTTYVPRPMIARHEEWISPAQMTLRDLSVPWLEGGIRLGHAVVRAMDRGTGFVHMEWFRNSAGEAVFGEIGARSGGGHLVDMMNYCGDTDLYRAWAGVLCQGRFEGDLERHYNVAAVFKRAIGEGRIRRIEGLEAFRKSWGRWICWDNLAPIGARRKDWRNTLVGDGFLMVRHPELDAAWRMMEEAAGWIHLVAG